MYNEQCTMKQTRGGRRASRKKRQAGPLMVRADERSKSRVELVRTMPYEEEGDRRSAYLNVRATSSRGWRPPWRGRGPGVG